ncbi:MAG: M16 family metallopeptidase, partial [Bradymonadaceae bacterium]
MDPTTYQLDNGLTVIVQPRPAAPVVACNVWIGAGSADESPDRAGIAHVHEHMLFKGTESRGVGEIAREVESSGGHINAFTSFDHTCYYVALSSRYAESAVEILSDAVRRSSFDADELDRELEVIREEIKRTRDNPSRVAGLKLFETAYEAHPYRRPIIGTDESISSLTRDDILDFYDRYYVPENMAVVLTGDLEEPRARELVDEYFGDMSSTGDFERPERIDEPEQTDFRAWTSARDVEQSHLRLGFHIPGALHEDVPALDLLSAVLGSGDASRLTQSLKRDREWFNAISTAAYTPSDPGLFIIRGRYELGSAGERTHPDALHAVGEELRDFRTARVDKDELERARTMIESQEVYGKQTAEGLATKLGRYQMVAGDPSWEQEYYHRLAEVTVEDLRRVHRTYLTPQNCSAVLIHPEQETGGDVPEASLQGAIGGTGDRAVESGAEAGLATDEEGFVRVEVEHGPTVVVQEDHSVETFAVRGVAIGGLRYESPTNNGVNKMMARLLPRGTESRSAMEIARDIESMAGSLNGLDGRNSSGLKLSGLSKYFDECFDLFADCAMKASIPEEEFRREQKLQLQSIRGRRDDLATVNLDQFDAEFFGDHPFGRPQSGREETVADLEPADVRSYHRTVMRPDRMSLAIVGDVEPANVVERAEELFSRGDTRREPDLDVPSAPTHEEPSLVVGELNKQQAHVAVGFDAPVIGADSHEALKVVRAVLSGQGGRLFYQLRDRQSLAYSVRARARLGLDASALTIEVGTSPDKIERALTGIFDEIRRLRDEPPSDEELERAERYLIGTHDIGLQKNSSRALSVALDELYGLGYRRSLTFGDRIESIGREE